MKRAIIRLDVELEGFLEEWLWTRGALSVASEPVHVEDRKLEALFQDLDETAFKDELNTASKDFPGQVTGMLFTEVGEQDWQVSWRENFQPLQIGSFRIIGEWENEPETPNTIRVYPGQAFGTGQHETTQLIVERLEGMNLNNQSVLDAGCGTGILAIVAERLGAKEVFGFDIDPDAQENMQHHLKINGAQKTTLKIGVLEDFELAPYDLILANITINILREIWPGLTSLLKPNGLLISSGILDEQKEEALGHLEKLGMQVSAIQSKGEWILIEANKA